MLPKPKVAPIADAVRGYAVRSRDGLRAGLRQARAARLDAPPPDEHARRLLYGFTVPVTLLRVAWADPAIRRSIVRRLFPPLACVAVFAIIGVASLTMDLVDAHHHPVVLRHLAADVADDASPVSKTLLAVVESKVARLIATLAALEWILVWIGREHHDQIAFDIAQLTAVPGEPLGGPPRLRLDFGWLKMKAWRAFRFIVFLALASPVAWLAGKVPYVGGAMAFVVEVSWAAYWACVFGIGNSFLVWERALAADEAPWFIRVLRTTGSIPLLGFPVRLYTRVITFATRKVWPACMAFEHAPWEAAGLAALRTVMSVPVVYLVTRPAFGPAATHAWVARAPVETRESSSGEHTPRLPP